MNFFTVIDALKGYHQVLLDDASAKMINFLPRSDAFNKSVYRPYFPSWVTTIRRPRVTTIRRA